MIVCVGLSPALGRVMVLSQLAVGDVNRVSRYVEVAAGKATNAARVIVQSGGAATVVSPLGAESADLYRKLAVSDGIEMAAVEYPGRIRWAVTLVDPEHGATEIVCNEPEPVPEAAGDAVVAEFKRLLPIASACVVAGSRLENLPSSIITRIVDSTVSAGIPLFLDIRGTDLTDALAVTLPDTTRDHRITIKINEEEFLATADHVATNLTDSVAHFARNHRASLVVTRGPDPVVYSDATGSIGVREVASVNVVNPIGSGDAFLGTLAGRMVAGEELSVAVAAAVNAAGKNTGFLRPGTIQGP